MPSEAEVFEKVKTCLVDALGVDDDEVTPTASIMGDLGAESIDWLDIVFKLEKSFGIKISQSELSPEDILTSTEYVQDGKVTAAGLDKLKQRMPFLDLSKFAANPAVNEFSHLLTVQDMVRFVMSKVN
ncbi:MAG: acyl carrier protein [Pirellulales bacterium]